MGIFKKWDGSENGWIQYIDFYDEHGKRIRKSTGSSSRSFAKEFLNKQKDAVSQRKKFPERYVPQVRMAEFVDNDYLPLHARGLKNERNVKTICDKLKRSFGHRFLHEITSQMVEYYKKNRMGTVADNTINNEINTLSGIFTKAIEWGRQFQTLCNV